MRTSYQAHGLLIRSGFELPLTVADADPGAPPDLVIDAGCDRLVPTDDPPGTVLARLADRNGTTFYSIGRERDRTVLRYPGRCEFVGDGELRAVIVHVQPSADPGVVPVLAAGALLAVHLKLRGRLVLHASSVRVGAAALAFVGASGMGKSTLATLLCTAGHQLVSDDVLRVDLGRDRVPRVYAGSTETRLRAAARELAAGKPEGSVRPTADGRLAVRSPVHTGATLPLAACVVPLPSREDAEIAVRRISGAQALMRLSQFPRVVGWLEPSAQRRDFHQLADLVGQVPVYEARIPWGPPFGPDLAVRLLDALGLSP